MPVDSATIMPWSKLLVPQLMGCPCKYVRNNDVLRMAAWNSATGVTLEFTGLLLTTWGDYIPIQTLLTPTTARAESSTTLKLTEGFLYHLQCRVTAGTVRRGECYVKVQLQQGDVDNAMKHSTLIADYVTADFEPVFPGGIIRSSLEGPGIIRSVAGTNPAVGAEIQETVPTNARWKLLSLAASLVASAAAANRRVHWTVDDGTTVYYRVATNTNQTASQTVTQVLARIGSVIDVAGTAIIAGIFGENYLLQGHRINSVTTSLDTGDNWGAPQMLVEEWIEE